MSNACTAVEAFDWLTDALEDAASGACKTVGDTQSHGDVGVQYISFTSPPDDLLPGQMRVGVHFFLSN